MLPVSPTATKYSSCRSVSRKGMAASRSAPAMVSQPVIRFNRLANPTVATCPFGQARRRHNRELAGLGFA